MNNKNKSTIEKNSDLCPYCGTDRHHQWASEFGYEVVRCCSCGLLFVFPMPSSDKVSDAIQTGFHKNINLNVKSRRLPKKIRLYRKIFDRIFSDILSSGKPVTWVDVGCGYGEVIESVTPLLPVNSRVLGYEPMKAKAERAQSLGLNVINDYLRPGAIHADIISAVDIFSHIPDFHSFLDIAKENLTDKGLLYLETGNLADLKKREDFPGELGVPDHLVFAGEKHLLGYLDRAGFNIEKMEYARIDGLVESCKNILKRLLGRPYLISRPYSSSYRQLRIRARRR